MLPDQIGSQRETITENFFNLRYVTMHQDLVARWAPTGAGYLLSTTDCKPAGGYLNATDCKLARLKAYNSMFLRDCSATDVKVEFGSLTVLNSNLETADVYKDADFTNSTCRQVKSVYGKLTANRSTFREVKVYHDLTLANSSAYSLSSEFGSVNIRDMIAVIRTIKAHKTVFAENCSIGDVECCNEAVIKNSSIENLTFVVTSSTQAILDLSDTQVSGKIVIKAHPLAHSLQIKGKTPQQIIFKGNARELTFKVTDQGTLVSVPND